MSFRRSSDKSQQGGTTDFSDYADKKMRINLWHYKIYFIIQTGGLECKELEEWILVGLKFGHTLPVIRGIDLNKEPTREPMDAV